MDSVTLHTEAWQKAFAAFGHDIPLNDLRGQLGENGDQMLQVFLSEAQLDAEGQRIDERRAEESRSTS